MVLGIIYGLLLVIHRYFMPTKSLYFNDSICVITNYRYIVSNQVGWYGVNGAALSFYRRGQEVEYSFCMELSLVSSLRGLSVL